MRCFWRLRLVAVGVFLGGLMCAAPADAQSEARVLRFRELTDTSSSPPPGAGTWQPAASELKPVEAKPSQTAELSFVDDAPSTLPPIAAQEEAAPAPPPGLAMSPMTAPASPAAQRPPQQVSRPVLNSHAQRIVPLEPRVTNQTRHALNFYGGQSARVTLNQMPRREIQPNGGAVPARPPVKPFQTVQQDPTVSPYMNLYHDDLNVESAPNYFAFVRPQMEQLEASRAQQYELHHLRGQVQRLSTTVVGPQYHQGAGMPATGSQARFMDTAQFYNGLRR
jgi:hypothetical protein